MQTLRNTRKATGQQALHMKHSGRPKRVDVIHSDKASYAQRRNNIRAFIPGIVSMVQTMKHSVERAMTFMGELGVGEPCASENWKGVVSKGDTVRSRRVLTQFRDGTDECTCGYTRTSCSEDVADTVSDPIALCRNGRFQCGIRAYST